MMMQSLRRWLMNAILLAGLVTVSAAAGAWWHYHAQGRKYETILKAENARLQVQKNTLQTMVDRMSRSTRLAQIVVTNQTKYNTTLLIAEIDYQNHDGKPSKDKPTTVIARQTVTIPGHIAFFDGLVVKFDQDSVAQGDPFRGRSIAILRRVYSESQPPRDGYKLDHAGEIPAAYQLHDTASDNELSNLTNKTTEKDKEVDADETRESFEKRIWSRFWAIANDPDLAKQLGVRVAQGEAVYKPMLPGVLYELTIDAAGGLNLETKPLPDAVADVLAAAVKSDR